jgi:hypothetical protein
LDHLLFLFFDLPIQSMVACLLAAEIVMVEGVGEEGAVLVVVGGVETPERGDKFNSRREEESLALGHHDGLQALTHTYTIK